MNYPWATGADPNGQYNAGESYVLFGRVDFTTAALNVSTLEPFEQLFASNTGNAVISTGQNWTLGSTTTTDNIFFEEHNTGVSPLLVDTNITQMIT